MEPTLTGRKYGVLYLIGRDRVGILQQAAAFVSQRGGTIEEGISHTLSTEAVVLLFVSGTPEQLDLIKRDAPRLGDSLQLMALFTRIVDRDPARDRDALPLTLRISSPDFPGLLAAITRFFTKHGLSIIAHHTSKSALPHTEGMFTYRHRFTVLLPPEFNRKSFLAELDQLEAEMNFIRDDISHSDYY
jgi:glycine cleavage system regulatory protein